MRLWGLPPSRTIRRTWTDCRWNLARITVRGLPDSEERLSVKVSKIGLAVRVR